MREIKCPNCGRVFQVDESGYARILQQVRDREFSKELARREKEIVRKKEDEVRIAGMEREKKFSREKREMDSRLAQKDREIRRLSAAMDKAETDRKLSVSEAVMEKNREISKNSAEAAAALNEKDREIRRLRAAIDKSEGEKQLAVSQALRDKQGEISRKDTQIVQLKRELTGKDNEIRLKEKNLKDRYEAELKFKDEEIERYKDFKARQSTKMVGESLEQHCLAQFNKIRMTAFPNAYFEKDNDARTGSKGDFIFRECDENGTEFISIMFEMKNESDETRTKHKNEDFFTELDKDRREKGCEYAVLVSMLEADSELYNDGIVDVSYRYEKMYVIRPQFFIPIITLLRNAALNSLKYRQELRVVKNQQVDLVHFEENMNAFKNRFGKNFDLASRRFNEAIDEIDKSIKELEKVKEALTSSQKNLRLANDKAQDLSIKKLTKNAPSVRNMFRELNNGAEAE